MTHNISRVYIFLAITKYECKCLNMQNELFYCLVAAEIGLLSNLLCNILICMFRPCSVSESFCEVVQIQSAYGAKYHFGKSAIAVR